MIIVYRKSTKLWFFCVPLHTLPPFNYTKHLMFIAKTSALYLMLISSSYPYEGLLHTTNWFYFLTPIRCFFLHCFQEKENCPSVTKKETFSDLRGKKIDNVYFFVSNQVLGSFYYSVSFSNQVNLCETIQQLNRSKCFIWLKLMKH